MFFLPVLISKPFELSFLPNTKRTFLIHEDLAIVFWETTTAGFGLLSQRLDEFNDEQSELVDEKETKDSADELEQEIDAASSSFELSKGSNK